MVRALTGALERNAQEGRLRDEATSAELDSDGGEAMAISDDEEGTGRSKRRAAERPGQRRAGGRADRSHDDASMDSDEGSGSSSSEDDGQEDSEHERPARR